MKKYLSIALSVVAMTQFGATDARAEFLPDGCYVSFANPSYCWVAGDGVTSWIPYSNRDDGIFHYGVAVESLMYSQDTFERAADQCSSELVNMQSNRDEWISYSESVLRAVKTRDALIKKLRKACGTKCKKIK